MKPGIGVLLFLSASVALGTLSACGARSALDDGVLADVPCATDADCVDPFECTSDRCDVAGRQCVHRPDDSMCPVNHVCDPQFDCDPRAFVHDATTLYEVRVLSGQVNAIGSTGAVLSDIAPRKDESFYGFGDTTLYTMSVATGQAIQYTPLVGVSLNGADVHPFSGELYASGSSALYTLDPASGQTTLVAQYPPAWSSSGDLAFLEGRLVASANSSGMDDLVEFDVAHGTSVVLGSIGYRCVWGLAGYGRKLYGFTCEGYVLSVDSETGAGTELHRTAKAFRGASTPP